MKLTGRLRPWAAHYVARCAPLGLALLVCAAGAGAQMYKWTDAKGVVSYSDQPPPASAHKVEQKAIQGASKAELPYALAQAAKTNPVVLYTAPACKACDQGRALLRQRGIPFAEKTVQSNDDRQKLKDAGGDGQVPLLLVGKSRRIGFEAGAWNAALTDAAYPLERQLPANWQGPDVVSAAPVVQPKPPVVQDDKPAPAAKRPKPPSDAPPGFQF